MVCANGRRFRIYHERLIEGEKNDKFDGKELCKRTTTSQLVLCEIVEENQTVQCYTTRRRVNTVISPWAPNAPDADKIDGLKVHFSEVNVVAS